MGTRIGIAVGLRIGEEVGRIFTEGLTVDFLVERADENKCEGIADCFFVGESVRLGRTDSGNAEGAAVVALEGWSVGVVVAIVLGAIEGRTIGAAVVGEEVGFVGDALGILVGVVGAAVGLGTGAVTDPFAISRNAALKDVKFTC